MLVKSKLRLLALLVLPLFLVLITGADHRDAPGTFNDPAVDINDVYAFVNAKTGNVVLAMTVNPFQVPGINNTFSPDALYQFKIDNTGDATEDLVIQVTFEPPSPIGTEITPMTGVNLPIDSNTNANPTQKFTVHGPFKPSKTGAINSLVKGGPVIPGVIDNSTAGKFTTDASTGIKVFAGLRDDPFFFDLVYILGFLRDPVTKQFVPKRNPGVDFFAGVNVSIIAIEVPAAMIKGTSGNVVKVWGTTNTFTSSKRSIKSKKGSAPTATVGGSKTYAQFDRMGLPAINTVLVFPEHKDAFNLAIPTQDKDLFRDDTIKHIMAINGGDATNAGTSADILLPDVLTLDVTKTVGFGTVTSNGNLTASLNGRRPEDDVISVEVFVLTKGGVQNVNPTANDVPFLTDFPFFAPPHQPGEGVPKRN